MKNFTFDISLWENSKKVYRLNLEERGLYLSLIVLAFKHHNSIKVDIKGWVKLFNTDEPQLRKILNSLFKGGLIVSDGTTLSIPSVQRHIDREERVDTTDYKKIMESFNGTCTSLPSVKSISGQRAVHLRARIKENSQETLLDVFKMVEASDFLTGRETKFKASMDWILKPANFSKIMEGNYQNKGQGSVLDKQKGAPAGFEYFFVDYKGVKVVPDSWVDGSPRHKNLAIDILLKQKFVNDKQ
tara:strand:- start:628 stop:1356 length:729 start_codon:yes stop_codon:yes gene_type:complete